MTQVELTYNPFLDEVDVIINSEKAGERIASIFKTKKAGGEWASALYEALETTYNDDEYEINFTGLVRDYEFLEDAKAHYKGKCEFKLTGKENCINANDQLEKLQSVFEWICESYPFDKSKLEDYKTQFNSVMSNEFEIAVVATMSSGKSTLINAMLGRELLPARNEATTATIAKIYDKCEEDKDKEDFNNISAVVKNANGIVLEEFPHFTPSDMDRVNTEGNKLENETEEEAKENRPSTIEIHAHIPGIHSSKNMRLVLADTPGPNNSQSDQHKEHTQNLFKNEYKPMVLYVLNATQIGINDDNSLIKDIAKAVQKGDRQSQERFLFVLNKADALDASKDGTLEYTIDKVKNYLATHNISHPRIFPVSAQVAKVIRQYLSGELLTETEEDEILPKYKTFNKREYRHFEKNPFLSRNCKNEQEKMLQEAQGNPYQQALIHTGIVSIELAITEYLQKYALPTKISEGVASFKENLDNLNLEAKETEKLTNNKAEVEKYSKHISIIEKALQNGEKAGRLREEIENFSSKEDAKNILDERSNEFFANINTELDKFSGEQDKEGVEKSLVVLKKCFEESSSRLKVALEDFLTSHIKNQVESYVAEYTNYVQGLFDNGLELTLNLNTSAGILGDLAEINSIEILNKYKEEKVVGSYEVSTSIWYKPWTWWDTETIHKYGEKVDCDKVKKEKILPLLDDFVDKNKKAALKEAKKQEKELKEFFLGEFEKLDNKIKDKIAEKRDMLSSKEKLEAALEKNRNNLAWLKEVRDELEQILSIKK